MTRTAVYPVTMWQKFLLDQGAHPDCMDDLRDRWLLVHAFLVRPGLDMRRLRRAVNKLRQRHDSLRIRFDSIKGVWRALIDPPDAEVIQEVDLGELDDAAFHAQIAALANSSMTLVGQPIAEFVAAKCGSRGDVLIIRIHHSIADGHGLVVLFEDLIKLLIGVPIFGKAVSHADYIARFQSPLPSQQAAISAFWQGMHRDFPKAPNVGRLAKGKVPLYNGIGEVEQRKIVFEATRQSLEAFEARAIKSRISAATTLSTGFLEALCQCNDLDKVMFITHVSRMDPALDTYMGDHKLDPILPYHPVGKEKFTQGVKSLGENMMRGMAHLPSSLARRGSEHFAALIEAGCFPTQFSVYQPRATTRQARSLFSDYFHSGFGEEMRFGSYRITRLDVVTVRARRSFDIQFDFGPERTRTGFTLHYDGISFTQDEIHKLGDMVFDLADLEQKEVIAT